jgi:hypothetical protein
MVLLHLELSVVTPDNIVNKIMLCSTNENPNLKFANITLNTTNYIQWLMAEECTEEIHTKIRGWKCQRTRH